MDVMRISAIKPVDIYDLHRVLTSNRISENQKAQFLRTNKAEINQIVGAHLSKEEFESIISKRPLPKFRFLKNSYTKWGDKIFLANALCIKTSEVPSYVKRVTKDIKEVDDLSETIDLPPDKIDMIKTYIYRHGSKDQVVTFLDYELTKADDKIKALYRNTEYHTGGVADYFIRPVHRMDNKTFVQLFNVIDKHIKEDQIKGNISEEDSLKISKELLIKLYKIKHNSTLINAIKTYKELKQN